MSIPIAWPEAQRICDIPEVREALDKFAADAHEENMLAMVSAIMGHAVTQGRAAGLEEAAKDCKAHADIFAGDERELVRMVRGALLTEADRIRALSPTPSDAGKDDARDAARLEVPHGWEDAIAEARNAIDCDEPTALDRSGYKEYANVVLDGVADKLAALSSLEVIGKGEKG